jgi:hypothetical protein
MGSVSYHFRLEPLAVKAPGLVFRQITVVSVSGSRIIELNRICTVSETTHLPSSSSTQYFPD